MTAQYTPNASGVSQVKSTPNGLAADAKQHQKQSGLDVVIVGAGLGGLTAAVYLRRQGHRVTILEQSRLAREAGAAVHLAPNSNGILRRIGIYAENHGANSILSLSNYDQSGNLQFRLDLAESNKQWQHPWLLTHRIHLHEALKVKATNGDDFGSPVNLRTSSKVVDIDTTTATAILENGERVSGDLLVGADGVHSRCRNKVPGCEEAAAKPSGQSAFRFLVPRKVALNNPQVSHYAQREGELAICFGADRRVVMYPCSNNEMINFVCIHPSDESETKTQDWDNGANVAKLLEVFKDFDPNLLALLGEADSHSLNVWELLDMETLPSWTHGSLALLGDAAHPFLPHQGQGAGCAMEDAAALAVVLPPDTPAEEIPERLKLYESFRTQRAFKLQEFSRLAGRNIREDEEPLDMMQFTRYNFGHDEWDHSIHLFRKWQWAKNPNLYWRMPISFGPLPGPRQDSQGKPRIATHSTFTTASIKFKTSKTLLQNLLPTDAYSFCSHGTVAYASFSQTTLDKMDWLGGGGYRHLGLYIHGVQYAKKNGEVVRGTYMPILFENLADPIVSGREELGMPKLYCSIDVFRRSKSYYAQAGWQGAIFGTLSLGDLEEDDAGSEHGAISGEADDGILVHRYVPKVGARGESDAEYDVFVPHAEGSKIFPPKVESVARARKASVRFEPMDWEALPTMHHIVSRLAEIPVYEVVSAKVVSGVGVPDVSSATRIE